jgi:hypothetical protein
MPWLQAPREWDFGAGGKPPAAAPQAPRDTNPFTPQQQSDDAARWQAYLSAQAAKQAALAQQRPVNMNGYIDYGGYGSDPSDSSTGDPSAGADM